MVKIIGIILLFSLNLLCAEDRHNTQPNKENQEAFWNTYTAALRGEKVAQYKIGVMFERGIWTDVNQSQAAKWYEKSAIQGHVDAQYNLGLMYASGRGVEENDKFAMMWLAAAAQQGDSEARKLLLAMVDGKSDNAASQQSDSKEIDIVPLAFTTKEGAQVCDTKGVCETFKGKTTLTSKRKRGNYYRISGIGTIHGWKAYEKEGWIEESSIEIRR